MLKDYLYLLEGQSNMHAELTEMEEQLSTLKKLVNVGIWKCPVPVRSTSIHWAEPDISAESRIKSCVLGLRYVFLWIPNWPGRPWSSGQTHKHNQVVKQVIILTTSTEHIRQHGSAVYIGMAVVVSIKYVSIVTTTYKGWQIYTTL